MTKHNRYSRILHLAILCCFLLPFFYTGCGPSKEELNRNTLALTEQINQTIENNIRICIKENNVMHEYMNDLVKDDPRKAWPYKKRTDNIFLKADSIYNYLITVEKGTCNDDIEKINSAIKKYKGFALEMISPKDRTNIRMDTSAIESITPHAIKKLRNDILNIEGDAVNALYKRVDFTHCGFAIIESKAIAKSKTVISGNEYEADIFLGELSYTSIGYTIITDYDSLTFQKHGKYDSLAYYKGTSKYEVICKEPGKYEYKGFIKTNFRDTFSFLYPPYTFKAQYEVVK